MLKKLAKNVLNRMGYVVTKPDNKKNPEDMEKEFEYIYEKCKDYTKTSIERMYSLYEATKYIVKHKIPGDIVECGVWKGGSVMVCALTLMKMQETDRQIYLYDTYEGMSEPTDKDITYNDMLAKDKWEKFQEKNINTWCYAPLEEVKSNLFSTGYPKEKLMFIKGKVEETIPKIMPNKISILRLDTDWYESTYHELCHLFPNLSKGGVVIIDDFGHWKGSRDATIEYFEKNNIKILLNRVDYAGRTGIKIE